MLHKAGESFSRYCNRKTRLSVVCYGQRVGGLLHLLNRGVRIRYLATFSPTIAELPKHENLECRLLQEPAEIASLPFVYAERPDLFLLEQDPRLGLRFEWLPPTTIGRGLELKKRKDVFDEAWKTGRPVSTGARLLSA